MAGTQFRDRVIADCHSHSLISWPGTPFRDHCSMRHDTAEKILGWQLNCSIRVLKGEGCDLKIPGETGNLHRQGDPRGIYNECEIELEHICENFEETASQCDDNSCTHFVIKSWGVRLSGGAAAIPLIPHRFITQDITFTFAQDVDRTYQGTVYTDVDDDGDESGYKIAVDNLLHGMFEQNKNAGRETSQWLHTMPFDDIKDASQDCQALV
jgi:hypothetical protein